MGPIRRRRTGMHAAEKSGTTSGMTAFATASGLVPQLTLGEGGSALAALASPPVLFFFLGMLAAAVRSNLHIPKAVTKLLSLYLLWAIGFKGGVLMTQGEVGEEMVLSLAAGMLMAVVVPVWTFFLLRRFVDVYNAAALAATYGSISAVTFMAACDVLTARGIEYGGHMVAAMALMESPAIVAAVILMRVSETRSRAGASTSHEQAAPGVNDGAHGAIKSRPGWGTLMHEAFLNGPVFLLLGSLLIGMLVGSKGYEAVRPLVVDAFSGVLVFFLLDLGILAARKLKTLADAGAKKMVLFALFVPLVNAACAIGLAKLLDLEQGNAVLLTVLCASASYIAVPAAARIAIPKAQPSVYLTMALGITFPFNLGVGIPLYMWVIGSVWS